MAFVDKALLQKQFVMTISASTLVNALMFVMNVERRSRLKLHSVFTKRIIWTYFPFSCSYCLKCFRRKDGLLLRVLLIQESNHMYLMCGGNVSESTVNCKTQDCLLRGEALYLPRMWPQFWLKEIRE
jgi:hypothetical protein